MNISDILGITPAASSSAAPTTAAALPRINIKQPYSLLAAATAAAIPYGALFLRPDGTYITIRETPATPTTPGSYTVQPMTAKRFTTWIEQHAHYTQHADPTSQRTSLSEAQASILLEADPLRHTIPTIDHIAPVRLPILRTGTTLEKPIFEPAPIGYDPTTRIYTADTLPITWNKLYTPESVTRQLLHIFYDFPLDGGDLDHRCCRSMGAIICAMLGQFLHHSIDRFPLIILNANQPGTGKSFLARAILAPVHGDIDTVNYNSDENELRKLLNTRLLDAAPYAFLDDIPSLVSNTVNRYVTSSRISDRIMGKQEAFTVENRMQFFITGNQLKTSKDVERRSLPIDLFCAGDATQRTIGTRISEHGILTPTWRRDMLTALWSLVAGWMRAGCPKDPTTAARISSFEHYKIAAHITIWAGFPDPFGPRQVDLDTGDTMTDALTETIIYIATNQTGTTDNYTVDRILEIATAIGKADIITGSARDPRKSLGQQMRRIKGRIFTDSYGRQFEVGNRRTSASSNYTITILTPPTGSFTPLADTPTTDTPTTDRELL